MMQFINFAASAVALFLAHYAAWQIIIFWFLPEGALKKAVFILISIFFISIILSSYLIHTKDNLFNRIYYFLSATWAGFLLNFLLSFTLVYILQLIIPSLFLSFWVFPALLSGLSLVISALGMYNAFNPKIKDYQVEIKDLPEYWQGKEVIQISDVHLGPIYRKRFFYKISKKISKLHPEAVFITGDLFDGMESDFSWIQHPFSRLNSKQGTYYCFGNHDLYLGFKRVKEMLKNSSAKIMDDKLEVVEDLQIIGINYSFNKDFDLYKSILSQTGYDKNLPSILLFHEPKNIDLAVKAGIDLQLSGHTHRGQMFPFGLLANFAYRGYGYGFHKIKNFNLIVNSGLGTWAPPMRTTGRSEVVRIKLSKA